MSMYYRLDPVDHSVIPTTDVGEAFVDIESRRVGKTLVNGHEVSTVFLGLDHGFGRGAPLLSQMFMPR